MKINSFDLLSGYPIKYEDICTFRPPTLKSIAEISYATYAGYIGLLLQESNDIVQFLKSKNDDISGELLDALSNTPIFDIQMSDIQSRNHFLKVVSFFVCEEVTYDEATNKILFVDKENNIVGFLDSENYEIFKDGICQINMLSGQAHIPKKFRNEKAKKIYEKIQKHKKEQSVSKHKNDDMTIDNIISSICAKHNSYNLLNIWDLTIYQLYNQFTKMSLNNQMDIIGLRWAAWGKDDFDFDLWFKNLNKQ